MLEGLFVFTCLLLNMMLLGHFLFKKKTCLSLLFHVREPASDLSSNLVFFVAQRPKFWDD
jgi:hypothetical protein